MRPDRHREPSTFQTVAQQCPFEPAVSSRLQYLPDEVRDNEKYDMRLRIFLELAKTPGDGLAIQFVRAADMTDEQKALLRDTGVVIVREQQRVLVTGAGSSQSR